MPNNNKKMNFLIARERGVHECHFYTNISPLPEKAEPYTQRITVTGHSSRRQFFTSPHSDQQQETMLSEASLTAYSNVHGHSDKHVNALQTPTSEKEFKLGSPSEHVQQCLANPIELDSMHSTSSQSVRAGSDEAISQTDDGDTRTRHLACLLSSKRTQEGKPVSSRKVDDSDQRTDERSDEFSESTPKDLGIAVTNTCLHSVSGDKSPPEGNKGGGYDKQARICQPPSELEKIVDASEDHYISSRSVPIKEAMDKNQSQCGMDRNFQFEIANDSRSSTRCRSYTSENPTYNFAGLKLPDSQPFSDAKQKGVRSSWQAGSSYAPSISGVGLDMNRVGRSMKLVSQFSHDVARKSNSSSTDKFSDQCGELPDNQIVVAATSVNLNSTNMEPSNDPPYLTQFEERPALCEENMSVVQSSSRYEELNQFSPERKRKNTAITSGSDDCKLCNCKKSKCLKLYCECFAAGIYCLDSCACNNCYNKLDYEDTVLDARQQIESRNPHAFAPKVITHAVDSSRIMIDRNGDTPSSGRHKRGCNCKKSKCRKKYCECYQSKVGCSDGCRCENCENSFGTKKVYGKVERRKNESCENLNIRQTNTDSIKAMGGAQTDVDNTSNSVPLAHPCSQAAVYSASSNLWNSTKVSPSQMEARFQADSSFPWQYPPDICKQQLHGSEFLHDPGHSHTPYEDIVMDVNTSETHHSLYLHEGHDWWSTK